MLTSGAMRTAAAAALCATVAMSLTSCGGSGDQKAAASGRTDDAPAPAAPLKRVPGVGDRLWQRVPASTRQVVAVYGDGPDSPGAKVELFSKHGAVWERGQSWRAHNGRRGWTAHHREGDQRSPVGVFTLSDAGGVLHDPGARLPYTESASFQAPHYWNKAYWHDFDYVIAIDYNRVKGTPPNDPVRPEGQSKGGSIWLHMDHGSGTSACVSMPESAMRYLLRTLDPRQHPVVVMGDSRDLSA
ncbi:L,D-transpeptidase family protein [Streptomyces sp. NPDC046985]|uniref:L,D-transpeptidase family protein n=1 Tax=Streptomyces sp. NPDC046985 TaxID=3155377 RepID=UPI0033F82193